MKLHILQHETVFKLTEPWTVKIPRSDRPTSNYSFFPVYFAGLNWNSYPDEAEVTFPVGTVFAVGHLRIKKQHKGNDYITLKIRECDLPEFRYISSKNKAEFSVYLKDINGIEIEIL